MQKHLLVFILFCCSTIIAQNLEIQTSQNNETTKMPLKKYDLNLKSFSEKSFYRSRADWQFIIDTTWGAGLPTEQKLQVFDAFWDQIDKNWGGFPNLAINWDSIKNYYRPIIESGISRGRFAGILSRMTTALNEWHAGAMDEGIDSTLGLFPDGIFYDFNYPNHPFFHYRANIPVININATYFRTPFGAGLTLLPDSSIMVYNIMENHPLNLQPGDIILGYNGIPWEQLLNELFEAELPILSEEMCGNWLSSTSAASYHNAMMSVGMNWGLFDTIDVVKYSTNDTIHYPTSLLSTINQPFHIATEQLPVKGVPFPDLSASKLVSWGVVEGTTIGYIYVLDWYGVPDGQTRTLFGQAVDELMHLNKVTGLILDFRTNPGGMPEYANEGFKHLFNIDPTSNYSQAIRITGSDHFAFTILPPRLEETFNPTLEIFDHPIAVLTGPRCGSSGDYNSYRLRFHPMSRSFGKETSGAYTAFQGNIYFSDSYYIWRVDNGTVYSNYNNEGYMIHKTFPVDEEVWLTREGVAAGKDDVVEKALQWIKNKAYAHDTYTEKAYYSPDTDSIHLFTTIENPNSHQLSVKAYLYSFDNVLIDSANFQEGLTQQTEQLRANLSPRAEEEFFKVSVTVNNETDLDQITLPNVARFTTAGPLKLDSISIKKQFANYNVKPFVHNAGNATPIKKVSLKLICTDPWLKSSLQSVSSLPDIAPKSSVGISNWISISYIDSIFPGYFNFKVELKSDGITYWTDSLKVNVITGVEDEVDIPSAFMLEQNYPNPFNPSTTINYGIKEKSNVKLTLFNSLGEAVALLINEEQDKGYHKVEFDGSKLSSGVYFYQLKTGNFVDTKKMILMR